MAEQSPIDLDVDIKHEITACAETEQSEGDWINWYPIYTESFGEWDQPLLVALRTPSQTTVKTRKSRLPR